MTIDAVSPSTLKAQEKKLIQKNEDHLRHLDEIYRQKIAQVQDAGQTRVDEVQRMQNDRLNNTNRESLERLQVMADRFKENQKRLLDEEVYLNAKHNENTENLLAQENNNYDEIKSAYRERLEDERDKFDNMRQKIIHDSFTKLQDQRRTGELKLQDGQINDAHKYMEQSNANKDKLLRNQNLFNQSMNQQKEEHDALLRNESSSSLKKFELQKDEHDKITKQQDMRHSAMMEHTHKIFMQRYQQIQKEHEALLKTINDKAKSDLEEIKISLEQPYKSIAAKQDNPFYRIDTLEHNLEDQGAYYLVTLKVPEYEKNFAHVSGNDKFIRIDFARRFEEDVDNEESSNRYHKAESFSKRIPVASPVDSHKAEQSYQDGMLKVKIFKK